MIVLVYILRLVAVHVSQMWVTHMVRLLLAYWSLIPNGVCDGAVTTAAGDPVHIDVDLVRNPEV